MKNYYSQFLIKSVHIPIFIQGSILDSDGYLKTVKIIYVFKKLKVCRLTFLITQMRNKFDHLDIIKLREVDVGNRKHRRS